MPEQGDTPRAGDPPRFGRKVGKLSNGWGRLEIGLARVWFYRMGGYKGVVLWAVIERSWCVPWFTARAGETPDPVPCRLNISELARRTGLRQPALNAAKRELIASGEITEHPDRTLEPAKQYHLYPDALPAGILAYGLAGSDLLDECRGAKAPAAPGKLAGKQARKLAQKQANSGPVPVEELAQKPANLLAQKQANSGGASPIREKLIQEGEQFAPASAREGPPVPDQPPPRPQPQDQSRDHSPSQPPPRLSAREQAAIAYGDALPGSVVPDEGLLARAVEKSFVWYPNRDDIRTGMRRHRYQFPTDWMFTCLKRLAIKGAINPGWMLLMKIMADYDAPGPDGRPVGPGVGIEAEYDDDLRRIPPSARGVPAARPAAPAPGGRYAPATTACPPVVEVTAAARARFALPRRPQEADGVGRYNGFHHHHDDGDGTR